MYLPYLQSDTCRSVGVAVKASTCCLASASLPTGGAGAGDSAKRLIHGRFQSGIALGLYNFAYIRRCRPAATYGSENSQTNYFRGAGGDSQCCATYCCGRGSEGAYGVVGMLAQKRGQIGLRACTAGIARGF